MNKFTIEELEALKDGTTPGPWGWHNNVYDPDERFLHSHNGSMCLSVDDVGSSYFEGDPILMAASPALVDALIAEKRAHAKLRAEVEELRDALATEAEGPHYEGDYGDGRYSGLKQATAFITRILEGNG